MRVLRSARCSFAMLAENIPSIHPETSTDREHQQARPFNRRGQRGGGPRDDQSSDRSLSSWPMVPAPTAPERHQQSAGAFARKALLVAARKSWADHRWVWGFRPPRSFRNCPAHREACRGDAARSRCTRYCRRYPRRKCPCRIASVEAAGIAVHNARSTAVWMAARPWCPAASKRRRVDDRLGLCLHRRACVRRIEHRKRRVCCG